MIPSPPPSWLNRVRERFHRLYGPEQAETCLARLRMRLSRCEMHAATTPPAETWNQRDALLITYADMLRTGGERPLRTLKRFLDDRLTGAIRTIHLLPFFPYSSDDGFSVIHYRQVNPDCGDWTDVRALGQQFQLMFDLVLNHVSQESGWFNDFIAGVAPARDYFIEEDPSSDLSAVVRPRSSPLLTKVFTRRGIRHVWTTFSADQVDLNVANPDVLFELLDILLFYVVMGARIIRLDAIAYLWKKIGTPCLHLPETHEVVKLFRDLLDIAAPHVLLLTETNVPHQENISYFGHGDEAHLVYQFSLPPLLLHALIRGSSRALRDWILGQPATPPRCGFLNFTASHDGIGIRPLEGLVPGADIQSLVQRVKDLGGQISLKRNADGSESPYELNITYFDALGEPGGGNPDLHIARFLCSQTIMLGLKGIPAVYFNSLFGAPNDLDGVLRTGQARSINRRKWTEAELNAMLQDEASVPARIFREYSRLLRLRADHPAFHPDGSQAVLDLDDRLLILERTAPDQSERLLLVHNLTAENIALASENLDRLAARLGAPPWPDLLDARNTKKSDLRLAPYQACWLPAATPPK